MSVEKIEIAPLSHALCEAASRLIAEVISLLDYYSPIAREAEISKYTSTRLQDMIGADDNSVLIATAGPTVIGFCISTYDDGLIWLAWFGVSKDQRKKGIGSKLLEAAIDRVRSRGCHKIWCDSRTSNVESRGVLLRAGFREICLLKRHWYQLDFWLWERPI